MNETELKKVLKFHAFLAEKTAKTSDIHSLIQSLISETVDFIGAHSGSIMVSDDETNSLKLYVSSQHPGIKSSKKSGPVAFIPASQGIAGKVFSSGKAIVVSNIKDDSENLRIRRHNDEGSFLSMPLLINKKIIGVMNLNRRKTVSGFTQADLSTLKSTVTFIAFLIEKENFLRTIEANQEEISGLFTLASILSDASDFTGRLEEFLSRLSEKLSLDKSAIIKFPQFGERKKSEEPFEILAAHKLPSRKLQILFASVTEQMKKNLLKAAEKTEPENDFVQPPTLTFKDGKKESELFCLPLIVEGRSSHMLLVSRRYPGENKDEMRKHYKFLYIISKNLSMAIERENMIKRSLEDQDILLENAMRNRIFLEISKDLASTLDPSTILQRAFDKFQQIISFSSISVLLYDDLEEAYNLTVQPVEPLTNKLKKSITESIVTLFKDYPTQIPITSENFHKTNFFKEFHKLRRKNDKFLHSIHLPVIISESVCGLIHLTRAENEPFSQKDLEIISQFTGIFLTSIKNAMIHKRTEKLAFTDPLTELFNHRYFQETLSHEFVRAKRYNKPLSLMVIDIDHFKIFNDTYGHQVGDKVLRHVAKLLRSSVREQIDTVARYGGEEFVVILPETLIEGAHRFAERIRVTVEKSTIHDEGNELSVKLSIGVGCTSITECERTTDLIEAADIALYQAKENGRNQVRVYNESIISHAKT